MKKNKTAKQQLEVEKLYPETDEEKNETKWTKGEKIIEESEEPNETDSSTITDLPRRRGRSRH